MSDEPKIILIREGTIGSIVSDIVTFSTMAGLIGLGWLIDSTAMQVVGALMGMISLAVRSTKKLKSGKITLDEAAKKIADWKAEQ